jgi:ectoine hydroxylase-related dioxygenase (phytanoyl-CoA dioxygenase family)
MFQIGVDINDPTFCFGINCLVIVDDMNELNGATCLLAGSQGLRELRTDSEEDISNIEFRALAPSGSLLLIGASTWHCAGKNHSTEPRRVIKLLFTGKWIHSQINYAAIIPAEVAYRLSTRAQRILGIS